MNTPIVYNNNIQVCRQYSHDLLRLVDGNLASIYRIYTIFMQYADIESKDVAKAKKNVGLFLKQINNEFCLDAGILFLQVFEYAKKAGMNPHHYMILKFNFKMCQWCESMAFLTYVGIGAGITIMVAGIVLGLMGVV